MNNTWHIRGGRIIDPLNGRDEVADLYIEKGVIAQNQAEISGHIPEVDARGLVVVPGLVDLHVHFREPGNDEAETIESGSMAAARGGFTTVVTMPNTEPAIDTAKKVAWMLERGKACGRVRLMPAGCITRGRSGHEPADLPAMEKAGAVAFTDDGATVTNDGLMSRAMEIAKDLNIPIMDHALDPSIAGNGVMHEGSCSARLGLPGIPSLAEVKAVQRDIKLSEQTGCAVHIQHVSSKESIDLIRKAAKCGIRVSGEVTPHHLALTDSEVRGDDTNFKMNPPLRSPEDREALLSAVCEGTLQAFATDHAPHCSEDKAKGFITAPFGVVGLETAVGITYSVLVKTGLMSIIEWVRRWTIGPARVLGLKPPELSPGRPADISILDINSEWTVRSGDFLSRSKNTPFDGRKLTGRSVCTFWRGVITWDGRQQQQKAGVDNLGKLCK